MVYRKLFPTQEHTISVLTSSGMLNAVEGADNGHDPALNTRMEKSVGSVSPVSLTKDLLLRSLTIQLTWIVSLLHSFFKVII
jgi:hypothetical protein